MRWLDRLNLLDRLNWLDRWNAGLSSRGRYIHLSGPIHLTNHLEELTPNKPELRKQREEPPAWHTDLINRRPLDREALGIPRRPPRNEGPRHVGNEGVVLPVNVVQCRLLSSYHDQRVGALRAVARQGNLLPRLAEGRLPVRLPVVPETARDSPVVRIGAVLQYHMSCWVPWEGLVAPD